MSLLQPRTCKTHLKYEFTVGFISVGLYQRKAGIFLFQQLPLKSSAEPSAPKSLWKTDLNQIINKHDDILFQVL